MDNLIIHKQIIQKYQKFSFKNLIILILKRFYGFKYLRFMHLYILLFVDYLKQDKSIGVQKSNVVIFCLIII